MATGYGRQMEDEAYDARRSKMKKKYLVGKTYTGKIIATIYGKQYPNNVIPASVDVVNAYTKNDAKILYDIYNNKPISMIKNNIRSVTINGKRFKV